MESMSVNILEVGCRVIPTYTKAPHKNGEIGENYNCPNNRFKWEKVENKYEKANG
jgi:hypothetical protein